ncbi:MAG: hypothetical protein KIT72_06165 [Polyangiaceae bacterium]|nr:hypothetical protein [Polyangiaceae bacterium]
MLKVTAMIGSSRFEGWGLVAPEVRRAAPQSPSSSAEAGAVGLRIDLLGAARQNLSCS